MTPRKGEFPPELLNADGTLKDLTMAEDQPETAAQQQADDAAWGRVLRTSLGSFFRGRQGVAIISLALLFGGREGWHALNDRPTVAAQEARVERKLNEVNNNILDVKIKVGAMLDVMPKDQKEKAQALIKDRLEVLAEARRQQDRSDQ